MKKKPLEHLLKHLCHQSIKKCRSILMATKKKKKNAFRQFQPDEVIRIIKEQTKNKALLSNTFQLKSSSTRLIYTLKSSRKIFIEYV